MLEPVFPAEGRNVMGSPPWPSHIGKIFIFEVHPNIACLQHILFGSVDFHTDTFAMASQYISELPASIPIDPSIPQFFQTFYQISDTPDAHDQYAASFTDDATLIMASKKAKGKEGSYFNHRL